MATLKQIEANRLNAQKSTGPTTATGKANSSQNALKSGVYTKTILIPGEDWDQFEALLIEYHDHYLPQSPAERDLVDQLIRDTWQLRRFGRIEVQMWEDRVAFNARNSWFHEKTPIGQSFLTDDFDQRLAHLHRMIGATKRSFKDALRELERLQAAHAENRASAPEPESLCPEAPTPVTVQPRASLAPIGFVPSTQSPAGSGSLRGIWRVGGNGQIPFFDQRFLACAVLRYTQDRTADSNCASIESVLA